MSRSVQDLDVDSTDTDSLTIAQRRRGTGSGFTATLPRTSAQLRVKGPHRSTGEIRQSRSCAQMVGVTVSDQDLLH